MPVEDVYLLAVHEPYESPRHPVPIDATVVVAATLLHPEVPQPDGGLLYRALTEFPGRTPGCLVPLSTITYEVGGRLWRLLDDWPAVVEAIVDVARAGKCDAMPLGLTDRQLALFGIGPATQHTFFMPGGRQEVAGPSERQAQLDKIHAHVQQFAAEGPFWPGDELVEPPTEPTVLPYQPGNA